MKAIVFDFDGVIHDTFELACKVNEQATGIKRTLDESKDLFMGNYFSNELITEDAINKFFALQHEAFKDLKIDLERKELIEHVAKTHSLFIITSNQEPVLKEYLMRNGIESAFKEVLGMETSRSKVEKFNLLFEKYGLLPDECLFITDTLGDVLEGSQVGVRVIAVDFGFHDRARLEKGNPLKIVSSVSELMNVLNTFS